MKRGLYVSSNPYDFQRIRESMLKYSFDLVSKDESTSTLDVEFVLIDLHACGAEEFIRIQDLRKQYLYQPIFVLTSCTEERELLDAFDFGVDGYLTKPCSEREIAHRLRAILRRLVGGPLYRQSETNVIKNELMEVDIETNAAECCQVDLRLSRKELELLYYLLKNKHTIMSREKIAKEVWEDMILPSNKTIDVHIHHLRRKLARACKERITVKSVTGKGYYLYMNKEDE